MKALVVHGGCDDLPVPSEARARRREGVRRACLAGFAALQDTGSALDAVEAAIRVLEDDPAFDAGTGSFLNLLGDIEMDALLALGDGRAGGVAAIERVQHPISVARQVMALTPHILLVGRGATRFARALGVPEYDPASAEARAVHDREAGNLAPSLAALLPRYAQLRDGLKQTSTVGAVAVDGAGLVVAGTSTGGVPQKLPGRVGDSALLGAGTYAAAAGGASATGLGEAIIRIGATRALVDDLAAGTRPQRACEQLIARFTAGGTPCGLIALGRDGTPGAFHNGYFMPVFYQRDGLAAPEWLEPDVAEAAYLTGAPR